MRTYELMLIYKPFVDTEQGDQPLKILEKLLKDSKGRILKTEKQGRKRLAYDMGNFKDGFQMTAMVEMEPELITSIRKAAQLNEDVLRLTIIHMNPKILRYLARPVRERERLPLRGRA